MSEGTSVWKALGITCGVLTALGACGVGGCFVVGMMAATGSTSGGGGSYAASSGGGGAAPSPAVAQLPWLATVRDNCARYDAAPNDIQKSNIFNENEQLIRDQALAAVQGELSGLTTSQGGGGLELTVRIGEATFTNGILDGIPDSSPVYQQAANLREGQCVLITATVTSANSVVERSKVCDLDYFVRWSAIEPCGA